MTRRAYFQEHPLEVHWFLTIQGQCTEVSRRLKFSQVPVPPRRGVCGDFSPQSRMRVLREMARINWYSCGPCVFVQLGYPDSVIESSHIERSKQRFLWHRYLEKSMGAQIPIVWRCEWEPRKSGKYKGYLVPHFHLILVGVSYIPKEDIRRWWQLSIKSKGHLHTDIRRIYDAEGVSRYVTSYMAKSSSLGNGTYHNKHVTVGRQWGFMRGSKIPRYPLEVQRELDDGEVPALQAMAKDKWPDYGKHYEGGFTLFGLDTAQEIKTKFGGGVDMTPLNR